MLPAWLLAQVAESVYSLVVSSTVVMSLRDPRWNRIKKINLVRLPDEIAVNPQVDEPIARLSEVYPIVKTKMRSN